VHLIAATHILAATGQQKLGVGVAIATVLFGFLYLAAHLRRRESPPVGAEIELAPNRKPYLSDEEMEGPKLEKALLFSFAMMAIIAIRLPLYWLNEPGRQAGAATGFENRAIKRGFELFQPTDSTEKGAHFGCAGCHGPVGQGGSAKYTLSDPTNKAAPPRPVTWKAPALNTVMLRFSPDEVRTILVYGRANTPMPAWGVLGGGPMNDQQIDDLVEYLKSIQLKPKDVKADNLKAYGSTDGAKLFDAFCSRCHTKGWSYGESDVVGGGAFGPSLVGGDEVRQFPNRQDQIDFVGAGTEFGKPYGVRGVGGNEGGGMPGFAEMLTPEQIAAIVDYERSL
jgi:mono/diheme cytochrome c family protein